MKYSYIKPRDKSAITPEIKLIITFFSITLFMLFSTYAFLLYKDYSFTNGLVEISDKTTKLETNIADMKEQVAFIEKENALAQKIQTKNSVLKDSITNLFDLVPERITLSEAKIDEKSLVLKGITPNKDVYNFMLQAPLRSIFHKTYSSFYPAKNGWLMFVSKNYMDEAQARELDSEN